MSTSYSVVNRMEGLFFLLWRDGVFSPTIGGNLFAGVDYNSSTTRQYYKDSFNMNSGDYQWKPLCSLDLFGHVSGSIVQQQVIGALSSCANNRDCWSPSRKYYYIWKVVLDRKTGEKNQFYLLFHEVYYCLILSNFINFLF